MKSTRPLLLIALFFTLSVSGCSTFNDKTKTVLHNLQPHRLWRMNRHPAPRRDVYYSVSDPIPALPSPAIAEEFASEPQTDDVDAPPTR